MYFTWFDLMPWPYLAEAFRAHHRQPEMFVSVVGGFLG